MTSLLSQSPPWTFPFCPTAPDWSLDWESIQREFDWIGNLKGCPQDPIYHARIRIVYLEVPFEEILRRNRSRTAMVPEAVIHKLAWKLEVPDPSEAHEVQWIIND